MASRRDYGLVVKRAQGEALVSLYQFIDTYKRPQRFHKQLAKTISILVERYVYFKVPTSMCDTFLSVLGM